MTCPCQGDLCNGPNTEREQDAFAGLSKLVARTHHTRNRRALLNTAGFISMNTNSNNRIYNTTVEENRNNLNNLTENIEGNGDDTKGNKDTKAIEDPVKDTTTASDTDAKDMESHIDTTAARVSEVKSDETQMTETTTQANVEVKNSEATTNIPITDEVIKAIDNHNMNETSIQIDVPSASIDSSDLKTEIIVMSSETTKVVVNDTKLPDISSTSLNVQEDPTTLETITHAAMESKAIAETTTETTKPSPTEMKMNENKVEPSEPMPTIGALQHDTTAAKTTPNLKATTTVKPQNSTAVRIDAQIFTLAIGVLLNYI